MKNLTIFVIGFAQVAAENISPVTTMVFETLTENTGDSWQPLIQHQTAGDSMSYMTFVSQVTVRNEVGYGINQVAATI